jgi:hypothetical protein
MNAGDQARAFELCIRPELGVPGFVVMVIGEGMSALAVKAPTWLPPVPVT